MNSGLFKLKLQPLLAIVLSFSLKKNKYIYIFESDFQDLLSSRGQKLIYVTLNLTLNKKQFADFYFNTE